MTMRWRSLLAGAAVGTALFAGAAAAGAQQLKVWKHGIIEPKGDAGFSLMVGQHDFAAKHGLKVEIVPIKNGATAHKALLAGELDSIESSPGAAILAGSHGADIKIIGCDWPGVPHGLMTHANINSVADLKGKTIAVAAPGSLPNLLVNAILEQNHMKPSDVRFANLGGDLDRYKAILAGVADAGIVASEFMAVAPKDIKMLVPGHAALPNYVRLCLTMTGKTVAGRHDDAVNFIAAEMDALHYATTHRDDTIRVTREAIHAKPDDPRPAFAYDDTVKRKLVDPDVTLPLDKLSWMQNELHKAGNLKAPVDLAKITAPDIHDAAAKLVGK
ncbi:MAG TPA: ABC transporter substrate-binding protein [Pseudolabrys sp.]|uniref:ABC transporter substrate-binding protein n=1 Tax=Pseudolabrys sp. TaxID=1960880 RepID=UPI002DDD6327|nr:ABC transporter substrate-binding protein [Pseudolabrys sp.]HEV2628042.1 ABC transporter substrate-binding protein [Pseudolabrys sp.]